MKDNYHIVLCLCCLIWLSFTTLNVYGQRTIFGLFRSDIKLGDEYFQKRDYVGALHIFQNVEKRKKSNDLSLRIARCHFALKDYEQASLYYSRSEKGTKNLPAEDLYQYAEARAAIEDYDSAIFFYRKYLEYVQGNDAIMGKIWQISNRTYLYEDSTHFAVRPVDINTPSGELCPTFYLDQLVFMSNRKETQWVEKLDATQNTPFYRMYSVPIRLDTADSNTYKYGKAGAFDVASSFHTGPAVFYHNDQKIAYVSSAKDARPDGVRTLQLYFSERKGRKWCSPEPFPYNSMEYSVTDPAISEDGTVLFFVSDKEGGFGGKDIYKSVYAEGAWSAPVNLGENINTAYDEAFPFLYRNTTLYFSSNGHPGLGGMDIFYSTIFEDEYTKPQNIGYPVNSSYDDFGIAIDSLHTHGYFTSNRKNGGYDDDIYEFNMDLQAYPVTINAVLKYKEHHLNQLSEAKVLPHAKISLIDRVRNTTVYETISDENGNSAIEVPYYSTYVVRVVDDEGKESHVLLEIPRFRDQVSDHEIVIVKDIF